MKKIISVILAALMCVGLCGCGKKEEVSPADAIAPYVERFVKQECRFKEERHGEAFDGLYIGDIIKNEDGDYSVTGVFGTVDEDGEKRSYAFTITARYYADGQVYLHEDTYAEVNTKYLS